MLRLSGQIKHDDRAYGEEETHRLKPGGDVPEEKETHEKRDQHAQLGKCGRKSGTVLADGALHGDQAGHKEEAADAAEKERGRARLIEAALVRHLDEGDEHAGQVVSEEYAVAGPLRIPEPF